MTLEGFSASSFTPEQTAPPVAGNVTFGGASRVGIEELEPGMVAVLGLDSQFEHTTPSSRSAAESIRQASADIVHTIRAAGRLVDIDTGRTLTWPRELRLVDLGDFGVDDGEAEDPLIPVSNFISAVVNAGATPVALGQDRSLAGAAFWGFAEALKERGQRAGLIRLSGDLETISPRRTPITPRSDRTVEAAIQNGLVDSANVVVLGLHGLQDYEQWQKAKDLGVTVLPSSVVQKDGIQSTAGRLLDVSGRGTRSVYVSIDIGVVDLGHAPGRRAIQLGGLESLELLELCRHLSQGQIAGLDVLGLIPDLDDSGRSPTLAAQAVIELIAPQVFV